MNEKWEDFNVKVNTTLAAVLGKVCLLMYCSYCIMGMSWSLRMLYVFMLKGWAVLTGIP